MGNRTGRATIKEVASMAGFSTQTVSRVINDRPDVSPTTRKRIKEVIEQLEFQPSALARSLIQQRSYTLGVVTAGLKYIGPSRTLSGITCAAEEAGYSLLIKELPHFDTVDIKPIFQKLLSRHVDGIIWAVPEVGRNRQWAHSPLGIDVPIVHLAMEPQQGIGVVSVDNFHGGKIATAHLLEQGYRHIGHISGPLDWWEARQRKAGWRAALEQAKIQVEERQWVEGNWSSSSGEQAIKKIFLQFPEMDAVFVANDQMALSVLQYACRNGIHIPNEMGVIGFDNIPESAFFWPPLSTIFQDQYKVGEVAVREIIGIIENDHDNEELIELSSTTLSATLIIRDSSIRNIEGGANYSFY